MDPFLIAASAVMAAVVLFAIVISTRRPDVNEGVNVEAGANDPLLAGVVNITRQVTYPGQREPESSLAIARYEGSGSPRVVKFIMARTRSYLTNGGHYVIYEHYRTDGSLEFDRMVYPEAMLGGGIYVKERHRFYDNNNKPTGEKYYRADGTLGLVTEVGTGRFLQLRKDGKTPRFEHFHTADQKTHSCTYRRDGVTVWEEVDTDGITKVHFDWDGNPVELAFKREYTGSFGMGPQSEPHLHYYDTYLRADGTVAYKQTWYKRWDKTVANIVDTLGAVVFYDEAGLKPVAEYIVDLLPAGTPRKILNVRLFKADGTYTVGDNNAPVEEIYFQGFRNNIWGTYDDESNDI